MKKTETEAEVYSTIGVAINLADVNYDIEGGVLSISVRTEVLDVSEEMRAFIDALIAKGMKKKKAHRLHEKMSEYLYREQRMKAISSLMM